VPHVPATVAAATVGLAALLMACAGAEPVASGSTIATTGGAAIFEQTCAVCHGLRGEGGAGTRLSGGATVAKFPRPANEEAVVRDGVGSMPAFAGRLTSEQINAVVAYTRGL